MPEMTVEPMQSSPSSLFHSSSSWRCTFTLSSYGRCVIHLLLLMAGDVELNPGPRQLPPVSHLELLALAEKVSHEYYRKLGLYLGCTEAKLSNLLRDKGRIEEAMYGALCSWWNDTPDSERRQKLVEALTKSGLKHLAEDVMQGTICTQTFSLQDASEEQIDQCRKDLMEEFAVMFCQVQTKPLDNDTLLELNDIYTNLILLGEDTKSKSSQPLKYEEILDSKINHVPLRRVLVQGEAGVGKTTFLAKIINDWIKGTHFQKFKLVVPVRLRELKDGKTIGEIMKSYLPDDNEVTPEQLNNYIRKNQEKVLILLDGYDELDEDISAEQCSHQILKILKCEEYKKCFVIITSRPWKVNHIRNDNELRKRYAFVEIKGFTRENVQEFVSRFFDDDKEAAESLVKFMEKGSLIAENMSPYPIFCAMLCHLWKEEARRKIVLRLQTFSQLFQEIMRFMKDSYLQRHCRRKSYESTEMALEKHLLKIAEVAFEELMRNNLVFSEDRFCDQALQAGYNFGLLSKDRKRAGGSESQRKVPCLMGKVFFPHKLFQEYLAGLHLAEQAKTDPGNYEKLLRLILCKNRDEMKFLLFFAAAQEKQVALDITSGLIKKLEQTAVRSTVDVETKAHKMIVDVVFEGFSEDVAREVEKCFRSLSRRRELHVDNTMSAHTVAGYFFTFQSLESVVFMKRSYGHALSSDLADKVCTLPSLCRVELKEASFQDVFYKALAKDASESRVKFFCVGGIVLESSASSCLAEGLCVMPHLESLTLDHALMEEEFYSTMAGCAPLVQIKELHLADMSLEFDVSVSKSLARAVCSMPSLKKLILDKRTVLHDAFYSKLAANASSAQIEVIKLSNLELKTGEPSHDLAVCLNAMPCLASLVVVKETVLHPRFFSKFADLSQINQDENCSTDSKMRLCLTLDDTTVNAWCKHGLRSIMPNLATFTLRCGRHVNTNTLNKMHLPELQELHIQAALSARDPRMLESNDFCRTMMKSFPGLQRLGLTHVSLGNQMSKVIIDQLKKHPSIRNIRFVQCHTDDQMDALCSSEKEISVSMEHGERPKM